MTDEPPVPAKPGIEPTIPRITRAQATTSAQHSGAEHSQPVGVMAGGTGDPAPPADERGRPEGSDESPRAGHLAINRGGLRAVRAEEVVVSVGGIGAARADRVTVELGGIGAVAAGEVHLSMGGAQAVLARSARFEQSFVRSIVAGDVRMGPGSAAGIVIARNVEGEVRAILDWRGALAAGAVLALAWILVRGRR